MKNSVRMGALIAVAAALVAGCTDESGSGTTTSTSRVTAASSTTRAPAPGTEAPGAPQPGATAAPEPETPSATKPPTIVPAPETTSTAPASGDNISGPGRCVDPGSTGVRNALAGLTGSWVAGQASADQPGNCGELLWVRAIGGNSAGAPIHVLFFHNGKYLSTGTSEPYAFTTVVGSSSTAVTVEYRWLAADEPFAAPQGGPATITYSWTGSSVMMSGPLPSEVTRPHR